MLMALSEIMSVKFAVLRSSLASLSETRNFSFEKAFSIALRKGLYGGTKIRVLPEASIYSRMQRL
jgi:hypothetical protein